MRRHIWCGLLVALLTAIATAATAADAGLPVGVLVRDCPQCPQMVVIPAGRFVMGSPAGEEGRFDAESPQHSVSVRSFALAKDDVTVDEFAAFVRETGYEAGVCDWPAGTAWNSLGFRPNGPVVCVSWHDAEAYIAWLNGKLRRQPVAPSGAASTKAPAGADGPYRLPSEAEWEYAARAGTTTARWWGDAIGTGNANCNGCGSPWDNRQIALVGSFPPNPFGLDDMLGNVWQWTADCWNENYVGAPTDGSAWTTGDCSRRVLRGGSWSSLPKFLRSAARNRDDASRRGSDYATYAGFRVARTLP